MSINLNLKQNTKKLKKKSRHDKTDTRARAREKKTEFTEAEIRAFVTHTRKESVFVRVRGSCAFCLFFFSSSSSFDFSLLSSKII